MKVTVTLVFLQITQLVICYYKRNDFKSQIINIQSIETRSLLGQRQLFFNAFGKEYILELQPNSVLAPNLEVFEADFTPQGYFRLQNLGYVAEAELGDGLFAIHNLPGSVFVTKDKNGLKVEGFIDDFYVKPTILKSGLFREQSGTHVAFKMPKTNLLYDKDQFEDRKPIKSWEDERNPPSEVTVEVLAVMDYRNSLRMNFDKKEITKFLAVEYGAVQRIYTVFKNPSINFRVTKIFINKRKSSEPYINNNMVDNETVESKCLDDFGDWAYSLKDIPTPDAAFLHMDYFIFDSDAKTRAMGLAHIGYACNEGAGMARNQAPYHLGYLTVAHELGHLLNAHHDGHWTSKNCPFIKGNLMGSDRFDSLKYIPSECTFQRITDFVRSVNASCLRQTSHGLITATQIFPGDVMTNDKICQLRLGPQYFAKQWPVSILCSRPLYCCNGPTKKNCVWMDGMEILEGTPCGMGMSCRKGHCVVIDEYQHLQDTTFPRPTFTNEAENFENFAGYRRPRFHKRFSL